MLDYVKHAGVVDVVTAGTGEAVNDHEAHAREGGGIGYGLDVAGIVEQGVVEGIGQRGEDVIDGQPPAPGAIPVEALTGLGLAPEHLAGFAMEGGA
ncbi:MAG: hypothetical protein ABIK79_14095, partial [Chloroflexota bacterium]